MSVGRTARKGCIRKIAVACRQKMRTGRAPEQVGKGNRLTGSIAEISERSKSPVRRKELV